MRTLLLLVGAAAALVLLTAAVTVALRRPAPASPPALDPGDREARRVGTDMARLLEAGLADPVLRTSDTWTRQAEALVREWFGSDRPGGRTSGGDQP